MKAVLALVAACVVVGTLVGYLVGKNLTDEPVLETLLYNVDIARNGTDKFALNYVCNGKVLASYDVDSKKIISPRLTDDDIIKLDREAQKGSQKSLYRHTYDVVLGFLTGGGAVKFARPVLTIVKSREANKYTIPGVIGALSGFYLGYSIATFQIPACDSKSALKLTQSDLAWRLVEGKVANQYLLQQMGATLNVKGDQPEALVAKAVDRIEKGYVDSKTFSILASIGNYIQPTAPQDALLSPDLILGVYIPFFILCCAAIGSAVLLINREARLTSARDAKQALRKMRSALKRKKNDPAT